jgi:ABC-type Zn uptake system ZnuABC Zn-binding protein ZnuA
MSYGTSVKRTLQLAIVAVVITGMLAGGGVWYLASIEVQPEKPVVVATSTLLGYFAVEIGKEEIEVRTLVNPGSCPMLYEAEPSDMDAVSQATLVIQHGTERWLDVVIEASGNKDVKRLSHLGCPRFFLPIDEGRFNTIKDAIIDVKPEKADFFRHNADLLWENISQVKAELKERAAEYNTSRYKLITIACQRKFASWLGFDVVDVFSCQVTMSVRDQMELVEVARKENVSIVVSNVQGDTTTGEYIAETIGAKYVVVTNVPGILGTETYLDVLEYGAQQYFDACQSLLK